MAGQIYECLGIEEFGRHLIEHGDLDPVYLALLRVQQLEADPWDADQRNRFLVAYWCFYDVGVACWMAMFEGPEFWAEMTKAAHNNERDHPFGEGHRWRRASERRYARGEQGIRMVLELENRYPHPGDMVEYCMAETCKEVMSLAKRHYLFGDWIAFKIADMLNACCSVDVSFDQASVFMFKDPRKAANRVYAEYNNLDPEKVKLNDDGIQKIVEHIQDFYPDLTAPPKNKDPIGFQEVETVLCKWKSHMNGHYGPSHDTREMREQLALWVPHTELADDFLAAMPEVVW